MDTTFNLWLGFIVISTIGTLAHFLYDWTHRNKIIGLFAAVNESTWEHIKFAPMEYWGQFVSCVGLLIFFGCYMTLTLAPLHGSLFKDPITGKYGFRAHTSLKNLKRKLSHKKK